MFCRWFIYMLFGIQAKQRTNTNNMQVPMFLPLLLMEMVIRVMADYTSVQVISYKKSRKTQDGPVMCAMDEANETISSSSVEDCSLTCARDGTCTGFNIKNSLICDLYKYKPSNTSLVTACLFYQVDITSNSLTSSDICLPPVDLWPWCDVSYLTK